jgi:phosphatidylserine/phosphatidylglycerophosphate/cardiolipin synthase-like enzyme
MSRSSIFFVLAGLSVAGCSGHAAETASNTPPKTVTGADAGGVDAGEAGDGGGGGNGAEAGSGPTLVTEPDQGMTPIYDFVKSATKTIDMTMYELVDTTFTGLLTTAAANGVTVRVILDQNLEMSDNTPAYNALSAGKVSVHWANPTYSATHQKTITVDGTTSAIMTLNLAAEEYSTSRDFAVITTDAADVAAIETTFAADFTNATITPPTGDNLVWSPTNALSSMEGVINGAQRTLLVENEEMSDDSIVSALSSAASRGVDVEVIMEDSSSYTTEFTTLKTAGVKIATYSHAKLYIHAKVMMADYGLGTAEVFIGSENFSGPSLVDNRELGIVLTDQAIMTSVNTTLTSDFNGGTAY